MDKKDTQKELLKALSPKLLGETLEIPASNQHPQVRLQNRLLFRNERHLYRQTSALSGKKIVSVFSPESNFKVYDQAEWWGDEWSELDYGREFDFSKTFTEQFKQLTIDVPHLSLYNRGCNNSYYSNYAIFSKNCYLVYGTTNSEDCFYSKFIRHCKDCVDSLSISDCQLCYEATNSQGCYNSMFIGNSRDCSDCIMVEECQGCQDCILSIGLYKKRYYVNNQYVGREAFEKYKQELLPLSRSAIGQLKSQMELLRQTHTYRASHIYNCENCSGEQIWDSKDCHFGFDVSNGEACKYLQFSPNSSYSQDCTFNAPSGLNYCYQCCSAIGSERCMATFLISNCSDSFYSMECHNSKNLFGCVAIKNQNYCIFNKQYDKEQYEKTVYKIICHMKETGEWGEFFDPSLSYFGYNETVAQEYYPMSKVEAELSRFNWSNSLEQRQQSDLVNTSSSITPETPNQEAIQNSYFCKKTGKPFKFNASEISFYEKMGLPLPEVCPDQRHHQRVKIQGQLWQWERQKPDSDETFWSSIPLDSNKRVMPNEDYLAMQRG